MTAGAGRLTVRPGGWRRLVRRAVPGTVRARVTAVAGLALTAAVVLGLVVMYWLQLNSADRTIEGQLHTYATQIEQSAVGGRFPHPLPASALDPAARAQVLAQDGTVLAAYPGGLAHLPRSTRSRRTAPRRSGSRPRTAPGCPATCVSTASAPWSAAIRSPSSPSPAPTCAIRSTRRSPGC